MLEFETYGETIIRDFLDSIKSDLIDYLDGKLFAGEFASDSEYTQFADRNASGASKASIQVVNVTPSMGQIIGASYIEYVFRGRGPGKMPPLDKIVDWCNIRGISRSIAWVIARNIAESGSRLHQALKNQGVNSVLDYIITEERVEKFIVTLSAIYTANLNSDIEQLFKAA
jgi:hypothetical protein